MRTLLSLTFLAARAGDWFTTVLLGGTEIEGNPLALWLGLFPTMAITSLFGLSIILFVWDRKPKTGKLGMAALMAIAFGILFYNLALVCGVLS
jgi:hypothetical protein